MLVAAAFREQQYFIINRNTKEIRKMAKEEVNSNDDEVECIPIEYRCDGEYHDCYDYSDKIGCNFFP